MYANINKHLYMVDHQQCLFELNVMCRSMSYDTLEHLKEDLCAVLSYCDDNMFPQFFWGKMLSSK